MLKPLYKANTSQNNKLVSLINNGLKGLKKENKKISKEEIEIEDPGSIAEIVEEIRKFNE